MAEPGRHRGGGPFVDYRVGAFVPSARHRVGLSSAGRYRLLAAALACLAVAAIAGGIALPGSSATATAGAGQAQGRPLSKWEPQPDVTSPGPITATTAPPRRARGTAGPRHRLAMTQARPAPLLALRSSSAPAFRPGARRPAVVVTYLVASQEADGFQGEIQVTNNTGQPIGNWQIVLAMAGDVVTSYSNAAGYVSNGILLLSPASPAQVAPPHGGVLDVFFVAEGTQTTPVACAFNNIPCKIP